MAAGNLSRFPSTLGSREILGAGDGFSNPSLLLVEHGYNGFQAMLAAPHHTWYIVHGTHGTLICQIYAIFSPLRAFMGQHRQNIMIRGSNQLWQCQHFGNI